jgi:hypothetical protein
MRHRIRTTLALAGAIGGGAAATACSDGGGMPTPPNPPQPPPAMGAERFGTGFALSARAAPNSDPREPTAADIIPLSLTTDPLDVP